MEFVGYLNERFVSDTHSYKVMRDGKKYYAVNVRKLVGNTKPQMSICGYIARCDNAYDVWNDPTCEIVEEDELFEIQFKNGYWGYKEYDARSYPHGMILKVGENQEIEHGEKYDIVYQLTPTKRKKTIFIKIAPFIENKCKYFHDYNF